MAGDLEPVTAWGAPVRQPPARFSSRTRYPSLRATQRPDRGVDRGPQQHSYGSASAIHSPGWSSEPIGSTMYCFPPCM